MPATVFLGPTMPLGEAEQLCDAEFRRPATRGDIYRAVHEGFDTIVLIDGEFHGRPAVWQREILDVMADGATVHGASSMGALRAAELYTFGMIGHGRIFEWYRDGVIDADDEVALIYGPEELGYPALSEPLVNIRATLARAGREVLDDGERARLIDALRSIYFPERSFDRLVALASPAIREGLVEFLSRSTVDQKREDARLALAATANARPSAALPPDLPPTGMWRRHRLVAEGVAPTPRALDPATIGRRAGLSPVEVETLRQELSALFFVGDWAERQGISPEPADIEKAAASFPDAAGLPDARRKAALQKRALAHAAMRSQGDGGEDAERRRAIITRWARESGVRPFEVDEETIADWVVAAGPNRFGYSGWRFEVELVEALQLAGRALSVDD